MRFPKRISPRCARTRNIRKVLPFHANSRPKSPLIKLLREIFTHSGGEDFALNKTWNAYVLAPWAAHAWFIVIVEPPLELNYVAKRQNENWNREHGVNGKIRRCNISTLRCVSTLLLNTLFIIMKIIIRSPIALHRPVNTFFFLLWTTHTHTHTGSHNYKKQVFIRFINTVYTYTRFLVMCVCVCVCI